MVGPSEQSPPLSRRHVDDVHLTDPVPGRVPGRPPGDHPGPVRGELERVLVQRPPRVRGPFPALPPRLVRIPAAPAPGPTRTIRLLRAITTGRITVTGPMTSVGRHGPPLQRNERAHLQAQAVRAQVVVPVPDRVRLVQDRRDTRVLAGLATLTIRLGT